MEDKTGINPEKAGKELKLMTEFVKDKMGASSVIISAVIRQPEGTKNEEGESVSAYSLSGVASDDIGEDAPLLYKVIATVSDELLKKIVQNMPADLAISLLKNAVVDVMQESKTKASIKIDEGGNKTEGDSEGAEMFSFIRAATGSKLN